MKKKFFRVGKRVVAVSMAVAMVASIIPDMGIVAKAAGTPQTREDETIIYAVDCGDLDPTTVPEDGPLGTHNSVTDQAYGTDKVTGYKWGIDDTISSPLKNGAGECLVGGVSTDWTWPNEQVGSDQTSKTASNRYTKNQYEKEHNMDASKTRHLDYKFELEDGEYYVEIGFTDPWSVSQSPSVYAYPDGSNKQVIKENFEVATNSGVATGTVKVTGGELVLGARATGSSNLAINMTYITIKEAGDAGNVATDMDAISIPSTATNDLELPTTGSKAGSTISWESSNESVISKTGKVTRPAKDDVDVVLTATVKSGEVSKQKKFTVTVLAENELMGAEFYEKKSVEVTDAYYDNALELDVKNLLALDADRLLAGFRQTACYVYNTKSGVTKMTTSEIATYMKNKTRYGGGWEDSLIGGHTLGHYISAVAQGIVNPGVTAEEKAALTERLNYIIDALYDCQQKTVGTKYEGYIFGATLPNDSFKNDPDLQFDNVESGLSNISTQAWVPWYTMHKILAGVTDAYEVAGNEKALEIANSLGVWISNRANKWSTTTNNKVLSIEYGGMNDALYQLYKVTNYSNKEVFKTAAHKFDETSLFESVLAGTSNILNNKHANTTIPKFLGALCRYETDNTQTKYLQYAEAFWQMVIDRHTYITGGNSEDEHFGADNVLDKERTVCNNETCNTYNMLKLSRRLFIITGEKKYADYYENTLINAIMSSQNHETGLTMYFQPMASGYQKVFGTLDSNFWCCTGSGYENFTKLQDSIYFKKDNIVIVNQYLASILKQDGYTIKQTGDLSKSDTMTLEVSDKTEEIELRLRIPDWVVDGTPEVQIDGTKYDYKTRGGYIVIPADKVAEGTKITVKLPMEVTASNLPDGQTTYGFKYGPFVLSAKLGTAKQTTTSHGVAVTVPSAKAVSNDTIGISSEETVEDFIKNINKYLVKDGDSMNFTLKGTNFKYKFTTHYNQDTENYGIYWNYYVDADGRGSAAIIDEKDAKRKEATAIDSIAQCGRGQYEERFILEDDSKDGLVDNGSIGKDAPDLSREATAGGSFGYKMKVDDTQDNYLLVTYAKEDDGKPMKITVGDTVITNEKLDSSKATVVNRTISESDTEDYYQVAYKIPQSVVKANEKDLKVVENGKTVTYKVITITFAGTDTENSARVNKSLDMVRAYKTTNSLTKLEYDGKTITPDSKGVYKITCPYNKQPKVKFTLADNDGYVAVAGNAVDETAEKELTLNGAVTDIAVQVYAQNFEVAKEYTIQVTRDYTGIDLKSGLVKALTFDDKADGAAGVTKSFNPAKNNAALRYEQGVVGKALTLPGTYGVELLDDASKLGESYTISYWMKASSVGNNFNPTLTAGTFSPEYWLNLTTDARIWSKNGSYFENAGTGAYEADKWQHVALVVDGSKAGSATNTVTAILYVDGVAVQTGNIAKGIMTNTGARVFFGVNAWDAVFKGALDDVLMYSRSLSAGEIQALSTKYATATSLTQTSNNNSNNNSGNNNNSTAGNTNNSGNSTVKPSTSSKAKVTLKTAKITVKKGKKKVSKVTVKKKKKVTLKVTVNSKGKLSMKKLSKKNKKILTATFKKGKLVIKGKKKGTVKIKITAAKTSKYKKAVKTITVKVK